MNEIDRKGRNYAKNGFKSKAGPAISPGLIRKDNWRNARKVYKHSGKPRSE